MSRSQLTLVARLRNSRLEHKPVREMSAGEQCLHWLREYRSSRDDYYFAVHARPYDDRPVIRAEEAMAEATLEFAAARERMRDRGRTEALERAIAAQEKAA